MTKMIEFDRKTIEQYYKDCGWDHTDMTKYLHTLHHNGYDESYDGSMTVFYFVGYIVIMFEGLVIREVK